MGAKAKISAEQGSTEIPCVDIQAYVPIVTLKFAGDKKTLLNALGFSAEWKVYDIENGWKKSTVVSTYHWEAKNGWVDKCTHPTDEKSNDQANNSSQNNTDSNTSKPQTPANNTNSTTDNSSNWVYKNGGTDFIIKTNGTEEIKIPVDMSSYLTVDKNHKVSSCDVERNCFYETDGYLFFWQKTDVVISGAAGSGIFGSTSRGSKNLIKYDLSNNSFIEIGAYNDDKYVKEVLFVSEGKLYCEIINKGEELAPIRGDICYTELNKNTVDIFKNRKVLFDFQSVSDAFYDALDSEGGSGSSLEKSTYDISGDKLYFTDLYLVNIEDTDSEYKVEIKYSINTDGSNLEKVYQKRVK